MRFGEILLSEATSECSLRSVLRVASHRTRYSKRSSSEETLTDEMKKDEMLSRNCFSRQKADGPTHHNAKTRLMSLANRGDRASRGSVPGKKVLRMYSGTPSRLLGVPGLAAFRKSMVAKAGWTVPTCSNGRGPSRQSIFRLQVRLGKGG